MNLEQYLFKRFVILEKKKFVVPTFCLKKGVFYKFKALVDARNIFLNNTYLATGSRCLGHSILPSKIFSYILNVFSSKNGGYLKNTTKKCNKIHTCRAQRPFKVYFLVVMSFFIKTNVGGNFFFFLLNCPKKVLRVHFALFTASKMKRV